MLPGDARTYRDRPESTKWPQTVVGGVLVWPEIPNIGLVLLERLRPPFAAISPARDDPYRCEHLQEAFSTLRYKKKYHVIYATISHDHTRMSPV